MSDEHLIRLMQLVEGTVVTPLEPPRTLRWSEDTPRDKNGRTEHQRHLRDLNVLQHAGRDIYSAAVSDMTEADMGKYALRCILNAIEKEPES